MLHLKVFSQFLFYLIGTFLHEASHWFFAKLTLSRTPKTAIIEEEDENGIMQKKEVPGFTIVPKIKKDKVVYGHVYAIPLLRMFYIFIAAGPLIWIVALYYLLIETGYLHVVEMTDGRTLLGFDYINFFSFENWLVIYLSLQLLWAGTMSPQDVKMFFKGMFSLSFLIAFTIAFIAYDSYSGFVVTSYIKELLL